MTTLTTTPLAPLAGPPVRRGRRGAAETDAAVADLSDEEQARLMRSKTDYADSMGA